MGFLNRDPRIAIAQLSYGSIPDQEYIIKQNPLQKAPFNTLQAFHWMGPKQGTDVPSYELIKLRRFLENQPYLLENEPDILDKYLMAFVGCTLCKKCPINSWFCDPYYLLIHPSPNLFIVPIIYPGSESIISLEFSSE